MIIEKYLTDETVVSAVNLYFSWQIAFGYRTVDGGSIRAGKDLCKNSYGLFYCPTHIILVSIPFCASGLYDIHSFCWHG